MTYVVIAGIAAACSGWIAWALKGAYDRDERDELEAQRDAWRENASMWHSKADELQAVIDVSTMSPADKARALGMGGATILNLHQPGITRRNH